MASLHTGLISLTHLHENRLSPVIAGEARLRGDMCSDGAPGLLRDRCSCAHSSDVRQICRARTYATGGFCKKKRVYTPQSAVTTSTMPDQVIDNRCCDF